MPASLSRFPRAALSAGVRRGTAPVAVAVVAALSLAAAMTSPAARAQVPAGPRLVGDIAEDYSAGVSRDSGGMLVGLVQGALPPQVDARRLHALLPRGARARALCLQAQTSDGFYEARGELQVEPAEASGALPVQVPGFSRYAERLQRLDGSQFAALFRVGGCRQRTAPIVPASFGSGATDALVAMFNTGAESRQEQARIDAGGRTLPGACVKAGGRVSAYNLQCRFQVNAADAGEARLTLDYVSGRGLPRQETHTVWIVAPQ